MYSAVLAAPKFANGKPWVDETMPDDSAVRALVDEELSDPPLEQETRTDTASSDETQRRKCMGSTVTEKSGAV